MMLELKTDNENKLRLKKMEVESMLSFMIKMSKSRKGKE